MKPEEILHTGHPVLGGECIHLKHRIIRRISGGVPFDKRPDLVLWVCHFPLPSNALVQCPVTVKGFPCPHGGPYGRN